MNDGDVILARVQQADSRVKLRPVVVLRPVPPYATTTCLSVR
jgi:hypothetical protein